MANEKTSPDERLARLREKAQNLPRRPGVYIMENSAGNVIYVGKSRSLRDRVYQYFVGSHDTKTSKMASSVHDFRFIVCHTEMEALSLENSLIKQYTPKYNIKLKDAKSYPYLKFTAEEYPRLVVTRTRETDGGTYFGPYSGISTAYAVAETLERGLGLPSCKRRFPADIGRERPCVYYQTGRCAGLCTGRVTRDEYLATVAAAKDILRGKSGAVIAGLEERMLRCAEEERYEEAAKCRDSIAAVKRLGERQRAVGSPDLECDVVTLTRALGHDIAAVFYVRGGYISDSEHFMFGENEITGLRADDSTADPAVTAESGNLQSADSPLGAFIMSLYQGREYIPPQVLCSVDIGDEEFSLLSEYLSGLAGRRVVVRCPIRGDGRSLCLAAEEDAVRHFENVRRRESRDERVLVTLAASLGLEVLPERIEAYDISNLGREHITAGMVVYEGGRRKRSDYRYFRIESLPGQDDYGAMRDALSRRLAHLTDEDGSFSKMPDLIMLDGGENHVATVEKLFGELGVSIPVCGMVKDKHHKTRALVTSAGEVSIARREELFRFVYGIQEEVHRFTISRMSAAKRKTLRRSSLEDIPGIGPAKAKALLSHFTRLADLRETSAAEIAEAKGVSAADARRVYEYFHSGSAGDDAPSGSDERKTKS